MGRKNIFNFKKYVSIDEKGNTTKCLLCNKVLKGKRAGNIKRHYEVIHNIKINENQIKPTTSSNCAIRKKDSHVQISMSKNEFLICCVGLVTVKNIPFRIFDDDEYFKKIIRPYEDLHKTSINSRNIVSKINISAIKIKENISNLVLKKMICLKIDVATHMDKSILGINIQYIKDSKININTIGIVQLKKRHTAQFLREEILKCLKEYNIDISQVYACTSDNGANVMETAKLLQDLQEEAMTEEVEHLSSDDDYFENIHTSLSSVMSVVRCAAHTIQLAAQDVLETIQSEIEECRKVVKRLRAHFRNETPSYFQMLIIDNITCWHSTFKMIKSLKNFKEYFESINDINQEPNWNFIAKFLSAFQPLSDCTNKFKSEQYIIGDFYRDWLCCEIDLEELSSQENIFAQNLLNAMTNRKQNLLTNEAFISAIYLDPRFNFIKTPFLSEEHKKIALEHLLKTHLMIKRLADQNTDVQTPPILSNSPSLHTGQFEKLEAKMNLSIQQIPPPTDQSMKQKLESLCKVERASFEANILEYYKIVDPELANIFDVALSVPSTQVSVERAFSALSIILTKTRSKLSEETINNLLLIKLNKNLIENIIIADDM